MDSVKSSVAFTDLIESERMLLSLEILSRHFESAPIKYIRKMVAFEAVNCRHFSRPGLMGDLQLSLSIRLISCSNVSIGNQLRRNCDPYCRVFAVSPTKVLLGRTHTIDGTVDAQWNAPPISTNAVRGI
jgi:hypothetical protein